ncbi:hypothetical protein MMC07_004429 [Pseudocyphellaria aurata]|nr:hypothetical protein [Pseudocyphellaria aurata]
MDHESDKCTGHVQVPQKVVSKVEVEGFLSRDEHEMALLGKKQQLRRNFGFVSIIGFSCTLMITWEGLLVVFTYGLGNGGPAGLVYGFLFCWLGYLSVVASMAELVSMAPTAGGQYHWVYLFAPPQWRIFLSYITGWQATIAWQAVVASGSFLTGTLIQGLIVLNYPNYVFERWHGTLLLYVIMIISLIFNTILARQLPNVERAMLVLHIIGFFAILIPLVVLAPHGSAHDVFAVFSNSGAFATQGVSFFVGLVTSVFAFVGADGAIHMCEEIKEASIVVPRSLIISITINGVLGLSMLLAVLFCIGNLDDALNTPTKYPFIEIFAQATGSNGGATGMTALVLLLTISCCIVLLAAASRMMWSFARDKGLPFSGFLNRVEPRTKLPLFSLGMTTVITLLLSLINIGSTEAFNALISLVNAGFLGSYFMPIVLLLWKRLRGDPINYGPWKLGKFGVPANIFALIWTIIAMFFSFWPVSMDPTLQTMNWACLLYGATMIFSIGFYFLRGRHIYKGPIIETSVVEHLQGA